jgi:hypothetical protein
VLHSSITVNFNVIGKGREQLRSLILNVHVPQTNSFIVVSDSVMGPDAPWVDLDSEQKHTSVVPITYPHRTSLPQDKRKSG